MSTVQHLTKLVADSSDDSQGYATASATWIPEAEQSVLGSLLLCNDSFDAVRPVVEAKHFYSSAHRSIFEAIETMVTAGKPADVITVHQRLKVAGKADESGGQPYLLSLTNSVASTRNAGQYAQIVRDAALRRELLETVAVARDLIATTEGADQALDQIATLFSALDRTRARTEPRALVDAVLARSEHWTDLEKGNVVPGMNTKLPLLDKALGGGAKRGKVIVLAARPSIGKTSLAQQIGISIAEGGDGVLMLSQEMSEGELVDRAAANLAEVNLSSIIEGKMTKQDWPRVSEAIERSRALPVFIDEQPSLSLLDIRTKVRLVKKRCPKLGLVVLDYLQLCASSNQRDSRHHQIEAISRGLKSMAKELDVAVLLLSQINRDVTKSDREPTLSDLKESGAIEEDADVVILLQPKGNLPDGSQLLAAILAKNRQGKRGRVALSFRGANQRWVESAADVSSRVTAQSN